MDRRALLATAGTVLAAGCSEIMPPPQGTATGTDARSPDEETTAPAAVTTDTATDEPTDTLEESTTEATTDEATATPSAAEREAEEVLATASEHLSEAHAAYVGFADTEDATLLDLTAAVSVGRHDVVSAANKAKSTLDDLPDGANADQRDRAEELRAVATFLIQAIRCQTELHPAHKEFTYVVGRLYAEQFPPVAGAAAEMRERSDAAADYLQTLTEKTNAESMGAVDWLDAGTYERKVTQLDREIAGFDGLADVVVTFRDGLETFDAALDDYENDAYRQVREPFRTAADEFESASDTIAGMDVPGSVADTVADLRAVGDAIAAASADMVTAANEALEYNWEKRDAAEQKAKEDLRTPAVTAADIDSVQELLDL